MTLSPCLKNDFSNWDDDYYVINNPDIKSLDAVHLKQIFTTSHMGLYSPLTILSFSADYALYGLNPRGYHATNLLLHLVNCLLVFLIIFNLGAGGAVAFMTSLFFGIHPMHVESVAWISERKDVLFALFFFFSILAYQHHRRTRSKRFYWASAAAFLLSLLAKPAGVALPLVLLLIDYVDSRELDKAALFDKTPFIVLAAIFSLKELLAINAVADADSHLHGAAFAFKGALIQLQRFFYPAGLAAKYPVAMQLSIWDKTVLSLSGIAAAYAIFAARNSKKIIFGLLFSIATMIVPLLFMSTVSAVPYDHYSYIPYIGLFFIAGEFCSAVFRSQRPQSVKIMLAAALALCAVAAGVAAQERCRVWKDSMTLWNDTLAKYPDVYEAIINRASEFGARHDPQRALEEFDRVLQSAPDSEVSSRALAYAGKGAAFAAMGRRSEALGCFEQAVRLKQDDAGIYSNLGNLYADKDPQKAFAAYAKAIALSPGLAKPYANRGMLKLKLKEYAQAEDDLRMALLLAPEFTDMLAPLGDLAARRGNFKEAAELMTGAINTQPPAAGLFECRGNIFLMMGRGVEADADFAAAIKLSTVSAGAYAGDGAALFGLGRYEEALAQFNSALSIEKKASSYYNRAKTLEKLGKHAPALSDYSEAVRLEPAYAKAYLARADLLYKTGHLQDSKINLAKALKSDGGICAVLGAPAVCSAFPDKGKP